MSEMKSKSQLGDKSVRKMIREYWETMEPEQEQGKGSGSVTHAAAGRFSRSKVKK